MSSSAPRRPHSAPTSGPPPPLTVATSLAGLEAVVLIGLGLFQTTGMHGEKLAMNVTTFLFFLLYGGFLAVASWQLYRLRSWARAPVVLAQLIQVLVGASFWGDPTTIVAVVSVLVALLTLAGIFHPASLAALEAAEQS
jgi:hypothetical protein